MQNTYKERVLEAGKLIRQNRGYVKALAEIHGIHTNNVIRFLNGKAKKESSYEGFLGSIQELGEQVRYDASKFAESIKAI